MNERVYVFYEQIHSKCELIPKETSQGQWLYTEGANLFTEMIRWSGLKNRNCQHTSAVGFLRETEQEKQAYVHVNVCACTSVWVWVQIWKYVS